MSIKNINIDCPHCQRRYNLSPEEAVDWHDNHIPECRTKQAAGRIGLGEFFSLLIGGLKVKARERFKLTGQVFMVLRDRWGQAIDARLDANLITTAGIGHIVDRIQVVTSTPTIMDYQAIGTSSTAAAITDTALVAENARGQGTLSQPTAATDRLVTTFAAGVGTGAITETGRLNAAAAGVLMARQVFSVVNKAAGDSLQVTHDITVS